MGELLTVEDKGEGCRSPKVGNCGEGCRLPDVGNRMLIKPETGLPFQRDHLNQKKLRPFARLR